MHHCLVYRLDAGFQSIELKFLQNLIVKKLGNYRRECYN